VVLGFDILSFEGQGEAGRIWGTSTYQMADYLRTRTWTECVKIALEAALGDLRCVPELTSYTGSLQNLWYCPVTMEWGEPLFPGG
jgi:hypothetical protein